jgi:PAS domain S-box-containing protein
LRTPLRVLIVEDLPEQAELVAHELTNAGFSLAWSIASDLASCRSAIQSGVDVVVADCDEVDVELPALIALVRELRDPPPVVSLSTDDDPGVARECLRTGASAFLHKFQLHQIGNLVRSLTEAGSPHHTATSISGLADARSFAENACDLIVELAPDGRLLYVNPSVERSLGYASQELTGRRAFELLHPDDLPGTLEFLRNAIETGAAGRGVQRVRRCDGSWCWLESSGNPYRTPSGERRIVAIAREIIGPFPDPREADRLDPSVQRAMPPGDQVSAIPPKQTPEDPGSAIPPTQTTEDPGLGTILLVLGEDSLRPAVHETLEEDGYLVLSAAGGEEAIERVARHPGPIDLLLSDAELPGLDGRKLAERVGASHPEIRVILMSDSPSGRAGPPPPGFHPPGFLRKPFTLAALRATVYQTLEEDPDRGEAR